MATIAEVLMAKGAGVVVAGPDSTVHEAAALMGEANVGSIIVKEDDEVRGIFTERDLLKRVIGKGLDPRTTPLKLVMSAPVRSCGLGASLESVLRMLTAEHIRHLVVLEDGALVGLIGLRDVLSALLHEKEQELDDLLHEER